MGARVAVNRFDWRLPRERWAWVAIALGGSLCWLSSVSFYCGLRSTGWPTADATITYSQAHETRRTREVDIRYSYVVGGHEYRGDRWRFSFFMIRRLMRSIEVTATQAAYPVGTRLRVAVDPSDPHLSVLEPGPRYGDLLWIVGGLFIGVTGLSSGRKDQRSGGADSTQGPHDSDAGIASHRSRTAQGLAAIAAVVLATALYWIYQRVISESWPTVDGRVLYSSTGGANSVGNHQTEIRYEYFTAGQRQLGAASLLARHDEAVALSQSHHVGQLVKVHYDPNDPASSELDPKLSWHDAILLLIALVIFAFARLAQRVADAIRKSDRKSPYD